MKATLCFLSFLLLSLAASAQAADKAAAPSSSKQDATLYTSDFGSGAKGWTIVDGAFQVEDGSYRGRVENAKSKLARAIVGDKTWQNYSIEARLRVDKWTDKKGDYGLMARYQGPGDYYIFLYKRATETVTIERKVKNKLKTLKEVPFSIKEGEWHDFKATISGQDLALEIDGKKLAEVKDESQAAGGAGLLVFWAEISCSNFKVSQAEAVSRAAK